MKRHDWSLYHYKAFADKLAKLSKDVEALAENSPDSYHSHFKAKLLKRVLHLILDEIPRDPGSPEFLQGNTLGASNRHWRRAKFLQRFRLFFRYHTAHKAIIYTWVSDENTLRKSGSKSDPYTIFKQCLKQGNPPGNWEELLSQSTISSNDV